MAGVVEQVFDLAKRERQANPSSPPLVPGEDQIMFTIEVFNQGDITATNVLVTDYVQFGFTFAVADNPVWNGANPLKPTLLITGAIPPGNSVVVNVDRG